jgi:prepilin-type N-terminal cleavage/methylation domain-containing protein
MTLRRARSLVHAFTLIELLVVVFILAAIAASAASVVGEADEQLRYEDTRNRLGAIRRAVLGRGDAVAPGQTSGFAADMGRLPADLGELLEQGAQPAYAVDPATGVGYGWRGPYLHALPSLASGLVEYPDGWGNVAGGGDEPRDFGWVVSLGPAAATLPETLTVVSRGADRADGGSALYSRDYPAGATPLVTRDDHLLNLNGWRVSAVLHNPDLSSAYGETLYLRLTGVRDGALAAWLSEPLAVSLAADESAASTFVFPTTDAWVAWGTRALEVVREDPASPGTYVPEGSSIAQAIDLLPRSGRPLRLPAAWSVR